MFGEMRKFIEPIQIPDRALFSGPATPPRFGRVGLTSPGQMRHRDPSSSFDNVALVMLCNQPTLAAACENNLSPGRYGYGALPRAHLTLPDVICSPRPAMQLRLEVPAITPLRRARHLQGCAASTSGIGVDRDQLGSSARQVVRAQKLAPLQFAQFLDRNLQLQLNFT